MTVFPNEQRHTKVRLCLLATMCTITPYTNTALILYSVFFRTMQCQLLPLHWSSRHHREQKWKPPCLGRPFRCRPPSTTRCWTQLSSFHAARGRASPTPTAPYVRWTSAVLGVGATARHPSPRAARIARARATARVRGVRWNPQAARGATSSPTAPRAPRQRAVAPTRRSSASGMLTTRALATAIRVFLQAGRHLLSSSAPGPVSPEHGRASVLPGVHWPPTAPPACNTPWVMAFHSPARVRGVRNWMRVWRSPSTPSGDRLDNAERTSPTSAPPVQCNATHTHAHAIRECLFSVF